MLTKAKVLPLSSSSSFSTGSGVTTGGTVFFLLVVADVVVRSDEQENEASNCLKQSHRVKLAPKHSLFTEKENHLK